MEVVMINKEDFKRLEDKVDKIVECILQSELEKVDTSEVWLDSNEVCYLLKISKRTLQRFRSNGFMKYSLLGRRCMYRLSEIQKILNDEKRHFDPDTMAKIKRSYSLKNQAKYLGVEVRVEKDE